MDNSLEMVVLLFGILRFGGVAVPLNPSISDSAVARMIEDADARAMFASERHCRRIDELRAQSEAVARAARVGLGGAAAWLDDFNDWLAAQSPQWRGEVGPEQDCNIIYSSGTTGSPKGIVHTHASRMHWAVDLALVLRYRGDCVTLCSLGLFSNITWVAMLCTVLVGGTMVVMPSFDAAAAVELMARERVSHGTFVPLQLEKLLARRGSRTARSVESRYAHVLRLAASARHQARISAALRLPPDRAVRPHRGAVHHPRARGFREQDRFGRQALSRHRPAHHRRR